MNLFRPRGRMTPFAFMFCLLLLLGSGSLLAQDSDAEAFSSREAIAQRLVAVRSELEDPGAGGSAVERELLQQLEAALYLHQEAVGYLDSLMRQAQEARRATQSWQGFDQAPPYSIRLAHDIRARHHSLQLQAAAAETRIRIVSRAIEDVGNQLAERQQAERRFAEEAETAGSDEARRTALAAAREQQLRSRILAETLAAYRLRRDSQLAQRDALEAALELSRMQIGALEGKVVFDRDDLADIQARIAGERSTLMQSALPGAEQGSGPSEQVSWKIALLDIENDYWNQVYTALNAAERGAHANAVAALKALSEKVDDFAEVIRLQSLETAGPDSQVIGAVASAEDVQQVERLQQQIVFAVAQLEDEGVRGLNLLDRLVATALAIWNTELYLAEEVSSIGGQKVTTFRAVTLGKLLRLAVALVVAWFLMKFLSRAVRRSLRRRPGVAPATVESAGNWTFGIGIALLIIIALNRVHIPFTAFAFLGGTLAIGIGFGAQTLLKNFISGIILSLERPFEVGDLVEVEGVIGRIEKIGMRASAIKHFDGIDTLLPNSQLLENRVSNWTYGNTPMRGSIAIGVAYDSSLRDVSRILLAVAREHGLVLEHPEPEVRFEEFGDNALGFRLLFWLDPMKTGRDPLASDLRFMACRALREAGVVIAFPQRDLHFDEDKPLKIELSRPVKTPKQRLP
jgi:small-conductance mechanosensitive channel